jgi:iron-sulfur cluster assembly accessory protein
VRQSACDDDGKSGDPSQRAAFTRPIAWLWLRVAVTGGGCSGFSYALDFDREEKPGDSVISIGGLKVLIDSHSAGLLKGIVIDYVTGLQAAGFKFINPNATGTCGCGTSFSA